MKLSPHFTFEEATYSEFAIRNGIDNSPDNHILQNIQQSANILEDLRYQVGPLIVSSWYRNKEVNKGIGGATNSAHMSGWAIDLNSNNLIPFDLCLAALEVYRDLGFDQIIFEYGRWMHISFHPQNRKQLLTIFDKNKGYRTGIITKTEYYNK